MVKVLLQRTLALAGLVWMGLAVLAQPASVRAQQTQAGDEDQEQIREVHALDLLRWHDEYTNPSRDPQALEKKLRGFEALRRAPNTIAMKALANAAWMPVGAGQNDNTTQVASVSGRPTCIAFGSDGSIYLGETQGGLWKSTDQGTNWTPLSDQWPTLAIGGVAVDPKNPKVIYAGTGQGMAFLDDVGNEYPVVGPASGGTGVLKSTDGGLNWYLCYPKVGLVTSGMQVNWANSNLVYLAYNQGIMMSSDSGATWTSVLKTNTSASFALGTNLVIDPKDAAVLYAAGGGVAAHQQTPSSNASIYKSTDSGRTWRKLTPTYTGPMINLAISPANHLKLWASIDYASGSCIDSSGDSGATWTARPKSAFLATRGARRDFLGYQGYYANALAVNPTNASEVIVGGLNVYRFDFSKTGFEDSTVYQSTNNNRSDYTHPDVHVLQFDPSGKLYALTDGGIHVSTDNGKSWKHTLNQSLMTFEFVGGDMAVDASGEPVYFVAGAQDNGLNRLEKGSKIWRKIHDGDGGRMFVDQTDGQTVYGTYVQSNLYLSTDGGSTWENSPMGFGDNMLSRTPISSENVPFYLEYDVNSKATGQVLLVGSTHVYLATGGLQTPNAISAITGSGSPNKTVGTPQCAQFGVGGEIFVGTRSKNVYVSTDQGASFSKATFSAGVPSCFATDASDHNIYMTTKTVGDAFGGSFFRSTDTGKTWTQPANLNLPATVNYYTMAANDQAVFVGSDYGVLYSTDRGESWHNTDVLGFPHAQVTSLKIRGHYVLATTYGRGMYYLDLTKLAGAVAPERATAAPTFSLTAVYPDPIPSAAPMTTLALTTAAEGRLTATLYDELGRRTKVLANDYLLAGPHELSLSLDGVAAGHYVLAVTCGGETLTRFIEVR